MAVALRDLDRNRGGRYRPALRLVDAPSPVPTPPSVYRRRRLLVLVVAVAVALATVVVLRAGAADTTTPPATIEMTVVVSAGETLWDIARRYAPPAADRSAWVVDVATRNGLDPAAVQPGTPILVPVESRRVVADPQER